MESQTKTQDQKAAAPAVKKGSPLLAALFRLALLLGPEALVVKLLSSNVIICSLACVVVLGIWLTVDIGPFRAENPAPKAAKPVTVSYPPNLAKAQWWSYLFCKVVVLFALFHSKISL